MKFIFIKKLEDRIDGTCEECGKSLSQYAMDHDYDLCYDCFQDTQ
jgi:hypothetical protein